jgi:hypothetical protein
MDMRPLLRNPGRRGELVRSYNHHLAAAGKLAKQVIAIDMVHARGEAARVAASYARTPSPGSTIEPVATNA